MTKPNMGIFGESPFFSGYKATLKQLFNDENWDTEYLSALGWAVLLCCFGVHKCLEEQEEEKKNKKQKTKRAICDGPVQQTRPHVHAAQQEARCPLRVIGPAWPNAAHPVEAAPWDQLIGLASPAATVLTDMPS